MLGGLLCQLQLSRFLKLDFAHAWRNFGETWELRRRLLGSNRISRMRYSHLAAVLTLLLSNFGEVPPSCQTDMQEECAGVGVLASSARHFGLKATRRDVPGTKTV